MRFPCLLLVCFAWLLLCGVRGESVRETFESPLIPFDPKDSITAWVGAGIDAGEDQRVLMPDMASLQGRVTDDGQPGATLTYQWSCVEGPGPVVFGQPDALASSAAFQAAGTYRLRLTANDGELSVSDDVTITVTGPNQPPRVEIGGNITARVGEPFLVPLKIEDDSLPSKRTDWSQWVSWSGAVSVVWANGTDFTLKASRAGIYPLSCWVTDGQLSASDQVTLIVQPSVNGGPDLTVDYPKDALLYGERVIYGDEQYYYGNNGGNPNRVTGWRKVSGPGEVTIGERMWEGPPPLGRSLSTYSDSEIVTIPSPEYYARRVRFSEPGTYVLALETTDGVVSGRDEVTIIVRPPRDMYHGTYSGMLMKDGSPVGAVQITMRPSNDGQEVPDFSFTGVINLGGWGWRLKGRSTQGGWTGTIRFPDGTSATVTLQVDWKQGHGFSISIQHGAESYVSGLDRVNDINVRVNDNNESPFAGSYSFLLTTGETEEGSLPPGHGFGRLIVQRSGRMRAAAKLPDGVGITVGGPLTRMGTLPFFGSLGGRRGTLGGSFQFSQEVENNQGMPKERLELSGVMTRAIPARGSTPAASISTNIRGSHPTVYSRGLDLLLGKESSCNAVISFGGEGRETVSARIRLRNGETPWEFDYTLQLKFSFPKDNGQQFFGTFRDPLTGRNTPFGGILLERERVGSGLFSGKGTRGWVEIKVDAATL